MNYGKVEERSSSRSRSPNTARRAATSAILTDILSRSARAPTSRTADARPGKSILIVPERVAGYPENGQLEARAAIHFPSGAMQGLSARSTRKVQKRHTREEKIERHGRR